MQHSMAMPAQTFKSHRSNQLQISQDQGGQIASREQLREDEDSEISELTQEYEEVVCEAPLQIQCLDNPASSIDKGQSPEPVRKHNQKDGKDSIDAFRSIDKES